MVKIDLHEPTILFPSLTNRHVTKTILCLVYFVSKKFDKYDHIPAHPMIPFPFKWNILSLVIGQVLIGINNKPNNGIVS